ncbi:MAG TPA: Zn-dependent hydrolase [Gemmatimonadaceae bacterium]|nr:Zn-dependent hydrolase [Gemmatimonadaceae bacterium]
MNNRLEQRLDELYAIGAQPDGGAYRGLYDDAWAQALDLVERWFKDAGLKTRRDAVGNLWGRADGANKGKAVVTGSHIDTVRRGGRLDGALGIISGLTAVESLLKDGPPQRTLEVVAICEEEGSRFNTNFWGSRAIVGALDRVPDDIAAAMRARGLDAARVSSAARDDIDTFIELHIEQGAVLESTGTPLAVVSAIVGTAHLEVTVTGRPDHAGTTPMTLRRDALAAAAAMIQAVESIARALGPPAVATVGRIRIEPDQMNVVPGRCMFTVDLRHSDLGARRALEQRVRSLCQTIASERSLGLEMRVLQEKPPVAMHPDVRSLLARAARESGAHAMELVSGAGHDAQVLAARCKVGMLFVPSIGGRSHCPEESTKPEYLELGTRVLQKALQIIAY